MRALSDLLTGAWLLTCVVGCRPTPPETVDDGLTRRDTRLALETCTGDTATRLDADLDGRPEVIIWKKAGRPSCRSVDLDADGRPDRITFFDDRGRVRRVESDFDRDGRTDEILFLSEGTPSERRRSTAMRGQIDTWEYYQHGRRVRGERDSNGDGVVDQWWDYASPDCPLIHSDVNGDGLADPGATIDYCREVTAASRNPQGRGIPEKGTPEKGTPEGERR